MKKQSVWNLAAAMALFVNVGEAHPNVVSIVAEVTPVIAARLLEESRKVITNRNLKTATMRILRDALVKKLWLVNGESIIIDNRGVLIEGWHRLTACVETNISFHTVVVVGVEPRAALSQDGSAKLLPDKLQERGFQNTRALASAINRLWHWESNRLYHVRSGDSRISQFEAFDVLSRYPSLPDSVRYVERVRKVVAPSALSWIHQLTKEKHDEKIREFVEGLASGVNLVANSPVLRAREFFRGKRDERVELSTAHRLAILIKAWNAHLVGQQLHSVAWEDHERTNATFPKLMI